MEFDWFRPAGPLLSVNQSCPEGKSGRRGRHDGYFGIFPIRFAIVALFAFVSFFAFLQPARAQRLYKVLNSGPYVIRSVQYRIDGATREFVLASKAGIEPGRRFPDIAILGAFIQDRQQFLNNERVLESVEIDYSTEALESGDVAVDVIVKTKDTWNIIALPHAKFDSNEGFTLSGKVRDYNFLGSMRPLELDLEYLYTQEGETAYTAAGNFSLPFRAFGRLWSWGLSQELVVWPDQTYPVSLTGIDLAVELPTHFFPVTITASQDVRFHEEKDADADAMYFASGLEASASIPTGLVAGRFGKILYRPGINFTHNWKLAGMVREDRLGPTLAMTHDFEFGRIDWKGNLRSGLAGKFTDSNAFNIFYDQVTVNVDATLRGYLAAGTQAGIAARFVGFNLTGTVPREDVGSNMRGILDSRMNGFFGLFFNLNLPVKIAKFPLHAIIGKDWLDFELQASPFFDYGLLKESPGNLAKVKPWYSGGLEVYVYPEIMRSFIIRASAGFDLGHIWSGKGLDVLTADGNSPFELYAGVGLMF